MYQKKQTAEPWNTILFSNCNKIYTHHIPNLLKFKTLIQKIMLTSTFHCFRKTEEKTGHINNEQKLHMHKSDYGRIRHLHPSTLRCATSYQFKFLVASHCTWLVAPCNSCPNTNVTQLRPSTASKCAKFTSTSTAHKFQHEHIYAGKLMSLRILCIILQQTVSKSCPELQMLNWRSHQW